MPAWSAAVAISVLATGCTSPEPSTLDVPDVLWPAGAPSGDFEISPWVQAVRDAEVLSSVAWNNLDYSAPSLIQAWGYDAVENQLFPDAEWRLDDVRSRITVTPDNPRLVDPGPLPLQVLAVDENAAGAQVTVCAASGWDRFDGTVIDAGIRHYDLEERADGTFSIDVAWAGVDVRNERQDECSPEELPVGQFDPVPEPPTDPEVELKAPATREPYGLEPDES